MPIFGDKNPTTPKAPALASWKVHQSRLPDESDLRRWFESGKVGGFGLVMGRVSGLVALDIDSREADELFRCTCPDLIDTMTVRSGNRGLPHYYFRIPPYWQPVSSWSAPGVDFRAEGTYVVAPNVTIGDKCWTYINDRMPRTLSEGDLRRIEAFSRLLGRKSPEKPLSVDSGTNTGNSSARTRPPEITAAGLRRRYANRVSAVGRNNALFETACYARDRGWTVAEVAAALVETHVRYPAPSHHPPETPQRREREAHATLNSAFSRPPRNVTIGDTSPGLPNRLREAMLRHGLDREARVLDAMLYAGFRPGQVVTPSITYAAVRELGIGRNAIYAALKESLPDGQPLFRTAHLPTPPGPPAHTANAAIRFAETTNPCVIGRGANPVKNPRGRPENAYVMPAIAALCDRFDVRGGYSDRLHGPDFASPATYRAALHRALVQRAPGTYLRGWLASRLGVSVDTSRRYDARAGVRVQARYQDWALSFPAIEHVIPDRRVWGQFIEDEQGRRYPPVAVLARQLLAKGKRLRFRVQDANYYSLQMSPMVTIGGDGSPVETLRERPVARAEMSPMVTIGGDGSPVETLRERPVARAEMSPMVTFEGDTDNPAQVAEHVYDALRSRNPKRALTRKTARALVDDYGAKAVLRMLKRVLVRDGVRSPAGLLKTMLRDCPKQSGRDVKAPAKARPSHRAWLSKMAESSYAEHVDTGRMTLEEMAAVEF